MTRRKMCVYVFVSLSLLALILGITYRFLILPVHMSQRPSMNLSIGIVDINRIKTESKVFLNFKEDLEKLNSTIHEEILEKETKLRSEFEDLKKQEENNVTGSALAKHKNELDKKYAALEKVVRERREELDEEYTKGLLHIKKTITEIMTELGESYQLKVILNKSIGDGNQMDQSIVLFCNEGLDLTKEVIHRLDKALPAK